ncbi:phage tail protein, partial [Microvirgula aerodenitrificans]|uniref:phage tail protein n=1 Tax=Microvirgula aerodenitrificans TaxID=57480 RepID=UPI00248E50CC
MQKINTPDGLFHEGNPATGELGTIVTSAYMNAVQAELVGLVAGLGGTLDPNVGNQISQLLAAKLSSKAPSATTLAGYGITDAAPKHDAALTGAPTAPTAPAGTATTQLATTGFVADALSKAAGLPLLFPLWCPNRAAIPAGYAPADGQTLSRSLYPDAWAGIATGNVPVVTDAAWLATPTSRGAFTAGDGATTFRLPDYNGRAAGSLGAVFMRGDGALSAQTDGVIQLDEFEEHYHWESGTYYNVSTNPGTDSIIHKGVEVPHATRTSSAGGTETRPLNVTGCWVIRLFGAVVNPGAADAAQLATEVSKLGADKVPFTAFLGANQSLASSGYQKQPGGLILQWGVLATP